MAIFVCDASHLHGFNELKMKFTFIFPQAFCTPYNSCSMFWQTGDKIIIIIKH